MAAEAATGYPVTFSVDYPDRDLNRLTTAFRIFVALPILVIVSVIGASVLTTPTALMILFRQKYPRWWYSFNLELMRFESRVAVYLALMRDEYPSTDEEQAVHLDLPYPDVRQDLNRWGPLYKWLLAIPPYLVLSVLGTVAIFVVIVAWFAILFTGRYPRGLFDFVEGVMRWSVRVLGYAFVLVTDVYPPFRLSA
ncbi:MAG TPA: DUF4389 domain-containing protein [Thermomicrobiales bacterium]|nr:DUF4389 domain-containing protein [Thermomicrobiales bacterium]